MESPSACCSRNALFDVEDKDKFGRASAFETKMFLIDKRFKDFDELCLDIANFKTRSLDFSCVFGQTLGDG